MSDTSEPREIEAKFEVDPAGHDALAHLEHAGTFVVSAREMVQQDDIYFDSAAGGLAAASATLRVRRSHKGAVMTFKGSRSAPTSALDAHVASRLEDEVPVDAAWAATVTVDRPLPDADYSPLRRARELVGSAVLSPIARIENERVIVRLEAGESYLELGVDRCTGTRLADGRRVTFDEVELEAKGADRAALMAVEAELRRVVPGLRPSTLTKLERTLG